MIKKASLLLTLTAALAFAAPTLASAAAPTLVPKGGGEPIATGTSITMTGSDFTFTSSTLGALTCGTLDLIWNLSVNDQTNGITGSNSGQINPNAADCTNGINMINYTKVTLTDLKSTVNGDAFANFTAEVDIGANKCVFTYTNVTGTYANGGDVLSFSDAPGIKSTPPACGAGKLDGSFTLELTGGGGVVWRFG